MTAIIIDGPGLARLKSFAEAHPIGLDELKRIAAGDAPPAGDREGYALEMPIGFRVVYSIEEFPGEDGAAPAWIRRMSMSQGRPGRLPSRAAVEEVARALGFPDLGRCTVGLVDDVIVVGCRRDPP